MPQALSLSPAWAGWTWGWKNVQKERAYRSRTTVQEDRRTGGQQDWWTDRQLHSSWQAPGIWASQHPSGLLSASSPPHFHFHLPIHLHIHIHIHDHVHIHLQLHGIVCPDSCSLTKWPLWALECTNLVQLCLAHLPATGRWKVKGGLGADAAHSALHWGKMAVTTRRRIMLHGEWEDSCIDPIRHFPRKPYQKSRLCISNYEYFSSFSKNMIATRKVTKRLYIYKKLSLKWISFLY